MAVFGAAVWWTQPVVVSAPAGAQITTTLPDGSTAQLNSGTTLSYDRGFALLPGIPADARTVTLEGEAFFSVTHHNRPFTVQTFNSRIDVLGTEFNVRARPAEGGATDVVVASGRVRVQQNTSTAPDGVILSQPGQRSRVTDSVAVPSVVDVSRTLAWRSRGFAVTDQPLAIIVRELERRYDLTLRLSDEARARGGSLSLYYARPADAETIIHDLCTARGLSYRPTTNGYEIFVDTHS
jgi:ferric-dicitrate binding protein FerR (iron transport regulator)